MLNQIYTETKLKMAEKYKITPMGSLGLLALGHVGILKWKETVVAFEKEMKDKKETENVKKIKK